jgi:hypothetical protein
LLSQSQREPTSACSKACQLLHLGASCRKRLNIAGSVMAVMFLTAALARGEAKYWIAHEASLIVIGTLHPNPSFPWFDGWHLTGTIDVDEVLFGPRPAAHIDYRFVCPYASCGDWRLLPDFSASFKAKGIWFLRPLGGRSWQPSTGFGFDALNARADYEDYIRRYKQIPSH